MESGAILISLLSATIKSGTIILIATVGEIIIEKSGVLNLGLEGIMLMGAVSGFYFAHHSDSLLIAILLAGLIGAIMGMIHAFMVITLRANQVVSGLALTMFGSGLSAYIGNSLVGKTLTKGFLETVAPIKFPLLNKIPFIGQIIFNQNILVYISYLIPFIAWFILQKTRWGLAVRSAGEDPLASEIMGIKVTRVRYLATIFGSMLVGFSGAYLSVAYTPLWVEGMTAGRGWITIALVIFCNWRPLLVFAGAYLFGGLNALLPRLQALGVELPAYLMQTTPYLLTILCLIIISLNNTRINGPSSLGLAYFRENRD